MNNFTKISKQQEIITNVHNELKNKIHNYDMDELLWRIESSKWNVELSYHIDEGDYGAMQEVTRFVSNFAIMKGKNAHETTNWVTLSVCQKFTFEIQDVKVDVSVWMPYKK